ncbi:GNAT family N-acetyltransferase [Saxibacter everestensis]|uniref:GNAT family N-acetyltransferase n=1 Tax=Saxibacter everestensis TaxID=2909229 RepID=A0ABY8QZ08_9MICO|nr:GNAT family N-acetyltransferase [Brevibacteriaceae bacterium ZFBP1038]
MEIEISAEYQAAEVVDLYDSVGWFQYTRDAGKLLRSLKNSHCVLTARNESGRLDGLTRALSDGETVCYVQDLLVRPSTQRSGIGRALVEELKRRYAGCRFFVLSTDAAGTEDAEKSHPFYRELGLIPHSEQRLEAFALPLKRQEHL